MNNFTTGDSFRSDNGRGIDRAVIVCIKDGIAQFVRCRREMRRIHGFQLPLSFLSSPACGWRLINAPDDSVVGFIRKEVAAMRRIEEFHKSRFSEAKQP